MKKEKDQMKGERKASLELNPSLKIKMNKPRQTSLTLKRAKNPIDGSKKQS